MSKDQGIYRKIAKENPEITGWFEGCHVHHKDGNHFNHDVKNYKD